MPSSQSISHLTCVVKCLCSKKFRLNWNWLTWILTLYSLKILSSWKFPTLVLLYFISKLKVIKRMHRFLCKYFRAINLVWTTNEVYPWLTTMLSRFKETGGRLLWVLTPFYGICIVALSRLGSKLHLKKEKKNRYTQFEC